MKYDIIFIIANDAIDAKAMAGKTYSQDDTVCVIMDNKDKTYVGFSNTDLEDGKLVTGCSEKEAAKNMLADNSSHVSAVIVVNCSTRTPVLPCQKCVSMILEMNELNKDTLLITPDKTYIKLTDAEKFKPGEDNSELEADDVIGETDPLVIATPMNGNGLAKSLDLTEISDETDENKLPFYHEPIQRESQNTSENINDSDNKTDAVLKTRSIILNSQEMIQQEDPPKVQPEYINSDYMQNSGIIQETAAPQYQSSQYMQSNMQYTQQALNPQYINTPQYGSSPQFNGNSQYGSNPQYNGNPQYGSNPQYNGSSQYGSISQQYSGSSQYGSIPQQYSGSSQFGSNPMYSNNTQYQNPQYMQQSYTPHQYINSGNVQSVNSSIYINSPYMNQTSQNYMQSGMMQSQYGQRYMNGSFYQQTASQRFIPNTSTDADEDEEDLIQEKLDRLLGGKR